MSEKPVIPGSQKFADEQPEQQSDCGCNLCRFGRETQRIIETIPSQEDREYITEILHNDLYNLDFEHNMAELAMNEMRRFFPNIVRFCRSLSRRTKAEKLEALNQDIEHTNNSQELK